MIQFLKKYSTTEGSHGFGELSLYLECQVETDSWQSTFLYVTLASVVVININSAIFQVRPVLSPVFFQFITV
jgi:hypothetical protein